MLLNTSAQVTLRETKRPLLSDHIVKTFTLPIESSVPALSELLSTGLRSHLTVAGARLVMHPHYKGAYPLNDLGRKWMDQGRELRESTQAHLSLRLFQRSLLPEFQRLYSDSDHAVKKSKIAWFPAFFRSLYLGCPCCSRQPSFCIKDDERCDEALFFRPELWDEYFGDWVKEKYAGGHNAWRGSKSWWDGNVMQQRFGCGEELIQKAIERHKFAKQEDDECEAEEDALSKPETLNEEQV